MSRASLVLVERVAGIEPASSAWKAEVLPLNYTRAAPLNCRALCTAGPCRLFGPGPKCYPKQYVMVEGGGFEPPKLARQIYSLIPLATREPLQKAAHCPDAFGACQPKGCQSCARKARVVRRLARHARCYQSCARNAPPGETGAGERNRTPDRLITNQLLYLLSYAS